MRFSESSQNSMFEKSIFGHFEVTFFTTYFFPRVGWLIPVSAIDEEYFNKKMSSLAVLIKKLFISPQKYRFWPILTTWVHIQSRFSQRTGKNSKNPRSVSWGRLLETVC